MSGTPTEYTEAAAQCPQAAKLAIHGDVQATPLAMAQRGTGFAKRAEGNAPREANKPPLSAPGGSFHFALRFPSSRAYSSRLGTGFAIAFMLALAIGGVVVFYAVIRNP